MAFADSHTGGVCREVFGGGGMVMRDVDEDVEEGDLLFQRTTGTVKLALATVATAEQAHYVAGQKAASGTKVPCLPAAVVSGRISGASIGSPVYLAEGSNDGQYTQTAPSTTGDVNNPIGFAISATEIFVCPAFSPKTVA